MLFTCLLYLTGPNLNHFLAILLPDQGSSRYYWKLPTRNFFAMVLVWIFYLANQLFVWGLIFWAQKNLIEQKTNPTYDLTRYNIAIVAIMVFFIFLHLIQTHIWFDGLAQDVAIITSQGSVIIMIPFF